MSERLSQTKTRHESYKVYQIDRSSFTEYSNPQISYNISPRCSRNTCEDFSKKSKSFSKKSIQSNDLSRTDRSSKSRSRNSTLNIREELDKNLTSQQNLEVEKSLSKNSASLKIPISTKDHKSSLSTVYEGNSNLFDTDLSSLSSSSSGELNYPSTNLQKRSSHATIQKSHCSMPDLRMGSEPASRTSSTPRDTCSLPEQNDRILEYYRQIDRIRGQSQDSHYNEVKLKKKNDALTKLLTENHSAIEDLDLKLCELDRIFRTLKSIQVSFSRNVKSMLELCQK